MSGCHFPIKKISVAKSGILAKIEKLKYADIFLIFPKTKRKYPGICSKMFDQNVMAEKKPTISGKNTYFYHGI